MTKNVSKTGHFLMERNRSKQTIGHSGGCMDIFDVVSNKVPSSHHFDWMDNTGWWHVHETWLLTWNDWSNGFIGERVQFTSTGNISCQWISIEVFHWWIATIVVPGNSLPLSLSFFFLSFFLLFFFLSLFLSKKVRFFCGLTLITIWLKSWYFNRFQTVPWPFGAIQRIHYQRRICSCLGKHLHLIKWCMMCLRI